MFKVPRGFILMEMQYFCRVFIQSWLSVIPNFKH